MQVGSRSALWCNNFPKPNGVTSLFLSPLRSATWGSGSSGMIRRICRQPACQTDRHAQRKRAGHCLPLFAGGRHTPLGPSLRVSSMTQQSSSSSRGASPAGNSFAFFFRIGIDGRGVDAPDDDAPSRSALACPPPLPPPPRGLPPTGIAAVHLDRS